MDIGDAGKGGGMNVGDLVHYQAQGFNCGFDNEGDGPALFIGFKEYETNDKSSSTVEILRSGKDKVEEVWELQVGALDTWEGKNESR